MRPYRTFTKTRRGTIAYSKSRKGKWTAHITACNYGGEYIWPWSAGPRWSFIKGLPGGSRAQARDNLDKRLVYIARKVIAKDDKQLRRYLKRLGFEALSGGLRDTGSRVGYGYVVEGCEGLRKARFYARRILKAHASS
jgi:hypothetical protein